MIWQKFIAYAKSWAERVLKKLKKQKKKLIYRIKLSKVFILANIEHILYRFILTFTFWTVIYFIFLFLLSFSIGSFLSLHLLKQEVLSYFTGAGAMLGGILAIVSSLSLFLMQNAAENFSSGFYTISARDKQQDVIYFFIIIVVVLLFSASLFTHDRTTIIFNNNYSNGKITLQVSIFLIGVILYLIYYMFRRAFNRMQPIAAIKSARDSATFFLGRLNKRIQSAADMIKSNPNANTQTSMEEYMAYFYQRYSPISYLNERISYLFDFHDKLLSKNEKTLAIYVLDSISDIIKAYFEIRSNSSLIIPTEYILATTSDSKSFLTPTLERLMAVGLDYARNYDNNGVSKVIHTIEGLCLSASNIKYISGRYRDNPIQEQCRGYLDQLTTSLIELKNDEGIFQAANVYGVIAKNDVTKNYYIELLTIYEMLDKLTVYSAAKRFEVGLHAVFDSYTEIIHAIIVNKWNSDHQLELLFEHLESSVILSYLLTLRNTLRDRRFAQEIAKPYEHLRDLILGIPNEVRHTQDQTQREWIYTLIGSAGALRLSLRNISNSMNNANHILVWSFGEIIRDMGVLLLKLTQKPHWREHSRELIEQAKNYLYQTQWFSHGATAIEDNNSYEQLIEAATMIGLTALEVDQQEVVINAIDVLKDFAVEMLAKQSGSASGRTEPRIMLHACFIGILALKANKTAIVDELKTKIQEFQLQYEAKWFTNMPPEAEDHFERNLLKEEVEDLSESRLTRARLPLMDRDSEYILLSQTTDSDIQAFITYIWS